MSRSKSDPTERESPEKSQDPTKKAMPTLTFDGPSMAEATEELRKKKEEYRGMGGPERIERQHSQGKLTVRERLDLLFDEGTFKEFGLLGHHQ